MDEHEHRPVLHAQLEEGSFELVTVGQPAEVVGRLRRLELDGGDFGPMPSGSSSLVGAGMDEQTMEPRVEPTVLTESAKVSPGADQRLLDGILGRIRVAQDPAGDGEEAVVSRGRQGIECLVVAALRSFDEIGGQPRFLDCRAGHSRCYGVWRPAVIESFIGPCGGARLKDLEDADRHIETRGHSHADGGGA